MALVSLTEYARMKGVAVATIAGKIERGVISKRALVQIEGRKKPKIDSEIADLDIEFFGDDSATLAHETLVSGAPERGEEVPNQYREAKTSTEQLRARKLELEIDAREGKLLNAEDVRKLITKLVTETKDTILNVPAKIAPLLVSIHDTVEMEQRILKALNEALGNLSRLETV